MKIPKRREARNKLMFALEEALNRFREEEKMFPRQLSKDFGMYAIGVLEAFEERKAL